MAKINLGRVISGGLLAGLIINISEYILNVPIFGAEMEVAMKAHGLPVIGNQAVAVFLVMGFVLGIATVWLYAAIRPRFGASARTAACAGLTVWSLAYLYPGIGYGMLQLFPMKLMVVGVLWGLVEMVIAAVAGAWLYKE